MAVVGIDLAGVPWRPTGFAVLKQKRVQVITLYTDEKIIEACLQARPRIVAIDAPLSAPRKGGLRSCDRELIRLGFRVLPPLFGGMRKLTQRGIKLSRCLRKHDLKVIEVHPRTTALLLFGSTERKAWVEELRRRGYKITGKETPHELDAVISAITGALHLRGLTREVGTQAKIVIPSLGAREKI